jgi:hypothetical protein
MQTANSNNNKTKTTSLGSTQQQQAAVDSTHGGYIDIVELTRLLIQKQGELNRFMDIGMYTEGSRVGMSSQQRLLILFHL